MSPAPETNLPPDDPAKEIWEAPALITLEVAETLGGANVLPESTSGILS